MKQTDFHSFINCSFPSRSTVNTVLSLVLLFVCIVPAFAKNRLTLTASDGVRVYAEEYPARSAGAPIILLFHQAGSNKGEYSTIAPRLVALGYHCLAIDQRSGGGRWGVANETVQHLGRSTEYLSALKDMEAALAWAERQNPRHKPLVWGSSYSSALVFLLGAKHDREIGALLAFSPGEYLGSRDAVQTAARGVHVPVYITSALDSGEEQAAQNIWRATASSNKTLFTPRKGGIHASSTLRRELNPGGYTENWTAVTRFLTMMRAKV